MVTIALKSLRLLGRDERRPLALLTVLALVTSAIEAMGAALVYLLLRMIGDPTAPIDVPMIGDIRARLGHLDDDTYILVVIGSIAAFFVLRAIVQILSTYLQNRVAQSAAARLSARLAHGYIRLPYPFHLDRNSADLVRNSHVASMQLVRQAFLPLIAIVAESVVVIAILAMLVSIATTAAVLAGGLLGLTAALLLRFVQPRLKHAGVRSHRLNGVVLRQLQEALSGIRDIKLLGREDSVARAYATSRHELARVTWTFGTLTELPRVVLETVFLVFTLAFFALTLMLQGSASMTVSLVGLFAYAGLRVQPSLHKIVSGVNNLRFSSAAIDDIERDLAQVRRLAPTPPGGRGTFPLDHDLRLEGVSLRYPNADDDALVDVDLEIRQGEAIGICGPTGSGKTTFVDVVAGLLEPTTGRVTVDGRDIHEDLRGWQDGLGVVSQTVFLTDDTLRRNIAFGVDDPDIDEEAVQRAVHLAQLDPMVASLPDGLDTIVGERGVRISGGQRQRVAIARTLYHRPPVLIFDEGTSALDTTTEADLIDALQSLRGECTILLVAHRLTTVRRCDRIVLIEEGRITGVAPYDELVRTSDSFRRMSGDDVVAASPPSNGRTPARLGTTRPGEPS